MLICIAVVSPVALFKLLAFVDPGTASGASMRAGMQSMGGIQGLLRGKPDADGDDTASQTSGGQSAGEASADAATTTKVSGMTAQMASAFGPIGGALAAGIGAVTTIGSVGTSVLTDLTNQEGVGHNTYQPDYQGGRRDGAARANREANGQDEDSGGGDPAPSSPSTGSGPASGDRSAHRAVPPSPHRAAGGQARPAAGSRQRRGWGRGGAGGASAAEVAEVAVVAL